MGKPSGLALSFSTPAESKPSAAACVLATLQNPLLVIADIRASFARIVTVHKMSLRKAIGPSGAEAHALDPKRGAEAPLLHGTANDIRGPSETFLTHSLKPCLFSSFGRR